MRSERLRLVMAKVRHRLTGRTQYVGTFEVATRDETEAFWAAERHEPDSRIDRAYHEEIAGVLHGLLIRLGDRLPGDQMTLVAEFIDANELGLALEQMADVLSEDEQPLSADERTDMLALVERMSMDDRVPQALVFCPAR